VIANDRTGLPWSAHYFREVWRKIARQVGIPDTVRSMDTRSGAITEATDAGAQLEDVRHAATHSDISMTQKYSRGSADKTAKVMQMRAAHRNKSGT
jgi:site-specific recombinase XerD